MELTLQKLDDGRNDWCALLNGKYWLDLGEIDRQMDEISCGFDTAVDIASSEGVVFGTDEVRQLNRAFTVLNAWYDYGNILHVGTYKVRDGIWLVPAR